MTNSLYSRIEAIESFAADVAHDHLSAAVAAYRAIFGPRNPLTLAHEINFAIALRTKGDLQRARQTDAVASEGLRDVYADPMRIGQILGNLISNAVKYGHPETPIDIHIEQREATVEITVTNAGPGIPPEDMPHLFERFMRSDKDKHTKVRGLGVGLEEVFQWQG